MTDPIDSRLRRWTGEFRDPAEEQVYRLATRSAQLSRMRWVASLIIVASLPYAYAAWLRFGPGPEFELVLACRIVVATLGTLILLAAYRRAHYRVMDRLGLAGLIATILQNILFSAASGSIPNILDVHFILAVTFIYIFVPIPFLHKAIPCIFLSSVFVLQIGWQFDLPQSERIGLIAWMFAANAFGLYASYGSERLSRREFAGREALRDSNAELSATNRQLDAARAAAERESRAKSAFLANVSHEFRTPLNAIIGFSDVMQRELFGPVGNSRYRGYVDDIHDSGTYLLSLINDVLDLAKVEAGKLELEDSQVDIPDSVAASLRIVSEDARRRDIRLRTETEAGLPPLRVDERAWRQVLLNLLSNAVKFSRAGDSVTVRALRDADGGLLLSVADTGIGIPPEEVETALQPFGQARHRREPGQRGTGLGLPLAMSLLEAHGGSLHLDTAPGRGTTVLVRLPAERLHLPAERLHLPAPAVQADNPPSTASSAPVT